jgi:hypothetical protein
MRKNVYKLILFGFLGPLSLFSFWIAAYWSLEIRKKYIYSVCSIKEATHFFITNWDNSFSIVEKILIPLRNELNNQHNLYSFGFKNRY